MKQWIKNSTKSMAACGAVAVMLMAGWQFGVGGTEVTFSENEVALENAIEGSGGPGTTCYATYSECFIFGCSYIYRCSINPSVNCTNQRTDDCSDAGNC